MRRSTLILLFSILLLWAGGLRVWYAWVEPHPGRVFDERYTLRNLKRATTPGDFLHPANAYYPGLSWVPVALVYRASETLAARTGEDRLRTFKDGKATATAYRLGRLTSTLYGLLALLVLYRIATSLFDSRIGLLAAFLLAGTFLHLRLSAILKPESLLLLTTLLAAWLALRAADRPSLARFVVAGGGVGLALSAKYNGGPVAFCLVALTVLLLCERRWRAVAWLAAAGAVAIVVFVLLNPWTLTDPELLQRAFDVHSAEYRAKGEMRTGGEIWRQIPLLLQLVTNRLGHGPLVGALGLAALPLLGWRARGQVWRTPHGRGLVMVLSFVLGYSLFYTISSGGNLKTGNWLVVLPWTSLGAAWLLVSTWGVLRNRVAALRPTAVTALAGSVLALGVALPATAVPYRVLLPSTRHVATIVIGNRLVPMGGRIVVSEVSREGAVLRRGGDYIGLLTLPRSELSSPVFDAADAELFPASRLRGRNADFYRERTERVRSELIFEVSPQLFQVQGPKLVAIVHGWTPVGKLSPGAFVARSGTQHSWTATLADDYRGRIVSLDLRLPRAGSHDARLTVETSDTQVRCVRLVRVTPQWRYFRCLRFRTRQDGDLRLRATGLQGITQRVDYSVRAWSRPRSLRAGVPALDRMPPD